MTTALVVIIDVEGKFGLSTLSSGSQGFSPDSQRSALGCVSFGFQLEISLIKDVTLPKNFGMNHVRSILFKESILCPAKKVCKVCRISSYLPIGGRNIKQFQKRQKLAIRVPIFEALFYVDRICSKQKSTIGINQNNNTVEPLNKICGTTTLIFQI